MSENEKKEQNPSDHDQPKPVEKDKFMEALTKDKGDEGLKEAFKILSKGEPTARVEGVDLHRAVATRDMQEFSIEHAKDVIHLVSKEGLLNSNEFVNIITLIVTLRAVKKDDVEGLKEAFEILGKGKPTTRVEGVDLHRAVATPETQDFSIEHAKDVIQLANKEGLLNSNDFVNIINLIITLRGVKKDDAEGVKEAFGILSKGGLTVRVKHVKLVIALRKISTRNDKEIFQLLDEEESLNCEEFITIFKLLLEQDEGDQTKIIYEKLKETKEDEEIILYGAEGVGKTWTAREVAALGVRKGDFDVVIWVHLHRIYEDDLSLQKSIASQLSVLAEYEEFVADQAAKKEKQVQEMNKDEPVKTEKKTEIAEVVEEAMTTGVLNEAKAEVAKEAKTKEDVMKSLITKAIEKKKVLLILDGDGEKSRMKAKTVPPIQKENEILGLPSLKEKRADSDEQKKGEGEKSGGDESQKSEERGEKSGSDETVQKEDREGKSGTQKKAGDREEENEKIVGLELTGGEKPINLELASLKFYILRTITRDFKQGDNEIIVKPLTWDKSKSLATRAMKREGVERNIKELENLASYFMIRSERLPARLLLISRIVSYFGKKEDLRLQKEKLRLQKEELALQDEDLRLQKEELAALQKGSSGLQKEELALQKEKFGLQKEKLKLQMEELALQDEELRLQKEELAGLQEEELALHLEKLRLQKEKLVLQMGELGLHKGKSELQKLRKDREMIRNGHGVKLLDVLIKGYEERLPKSVLIDCYSPEMPKDHFMYGGRAVNFNELICYWIIEGHLGHFDRIDEAYLKGHNVLMELMDCGLLRNYEADYVAPSGATTFNFLIHDYAAFFRGLRPGLAVTFDMSLGRVTLGDGMIRTISSESSNNDEPQIISTLLLDGNRIGEEELPMKSLCKHKDQVKVLAISDPTKQHFELPILEMRNLRLLALSGCQFLDSLDNFLYKKSDKENDQAVQLDKENDPSPKTPIPRNLISEKLEKLTVLEISGPSSLEPIPEKLFDFMPKLKTVNLSELRKVEVLPDSFYNLPEIEFLILRGCESLRGLRSLKKFKNLKILDVSHATSFEKFEDKSLQNNTELQVLNISNTKLKTLPLINQLKKLKFVWLGDCEVLPRIRKIDKMGNLKIFDIGGAKDVERFCDPSLEDLNKLEIVDMSRTKIRRLPANIGDPTYLHATDCLKLKVVPPVEGLTKLEVLDLSGCVNLGEVRGEFFANIKESLRELNLSKTKVKALPFLSSLISLRRLLLCECESLEKIEKLNCLEKLEFVDFSGCKNVLELEDGSFDKMIHLYHLNLSRTGLGSRTDDPGVQKKPLPSLFKLVNLKELHVRNCPNLTQLSGVEEIPNLEILDYSGTVLESPPSFKNPNRPKVVGAGIESIDTSHLFKTLGAQLQDNDHFKFRQEEVSECQWIISNSRAENEEEKLGKTVYGAHFHRLLDNCPSFLTKILSKFYFLVYPSEAEANVKARFTDDNPYSKEVSLREIYFDQVCNQKMERCLEIREFIELPKSLHRLIAQAQFIVLVHNTFLKSLLDLHVDNTMPVKACWIESCNELQYIVAAPEKPQKTQEEAKSEEEQRKNEAASKSGELVKGKPGLRKKNAALKAREDTKEKGGQQKNETSGEDARGTDNQHKNDADAKSGGDQQQNAVVKDKSKESANGAGDQQENTEVEKAGQSATSEGNQPKTLSADNAGESEKGEANQQKHVAEEKSVDSKKNGGGEKKTVVDEKSEEPTKKEADQSNSAAANNAGESEKGEADQQKPVAKEKQVDSENNEENEKKTHADEKSEEPTQKESDQSNNATENKTGELEKDEANQQKHVVQEKPADSEKNDGDKKKTEADEKSEEPTMKEADQSKNDNAGELAKTEDEEENAAKNFNKIEILWISDALKMKSVCKGDIESVNFNSLKSLYLEFCPDLSEICSSSLQLKNLETLFIKYCPNLKSLFTDNNNASKMENLSHLQLWGLDSLKKINCKTPLLRKLRVGECPLLEHLLLSRVGVGQENEGHAKLEILHIKSCDKLKGIFESSQDFVQFESLEELELQGLPQLRNVAHEASSLLSLRVADCPALKSVIATADGVPKLKILEVRNCVKMKTIIKGGASKLNVTKIELLGLPELENVGAVELPRKNGCIIWACPKLKDFEFVG